MNPLNSGNLEIKWLEDFISLTAMRSFSQAARARNLSQPAFSRRIQALEDWLGTALVDRSANPHTLTATGRNFLVFAVDVVRQTNEARLLFRGQQQLAESEIKFAVAHTLAATFFPTWYSGADKLMKKAKASASVEATNIMEGSQALKAGEVDFFLSYHHPHLPVLLDPDRFPSEVLGRERFMLFSAQSKNTPKYRLTPPSLDYVPYLAYSSGTFLGHVADMILLNSAVLPVLKKCFQTHMAETLKAMVVAGHGVGWLPEQCVAQELKDGRVVSLGGEDAVAALEIRIYCAAENRRTVVTNLWREVAEKHKHAR